MHLCAVVYILLEHLLPNRLIRIVRQRADTFLSFEACVWLGRCSFARTVSSGKKSKLRSALEVAEGEKLPELEGFCWGAKSDPRSSLFPFLSPSFFLALSCCEFFIALFNGGFCVLTSVGSLDVSWIEIMGAPCAVHGHAQQRQRFVARR